MRADAPRCIVGAVLWSFAATACAASGWSLWVENDVASERIVRVEDGGDAQDWLLRPFESAIVAWRGTPPSGPITELDAETCQLIRRVDEVPRYHTVVFIAADDELLVGESGPHGDRITGSPTDRCNPP